MVGSDYLFEISIASVNPINFDLDGLDLSLYGNKGQQIAVHFDTSDGVYPIHWTQNALIDFMGVV